MKPIPRYATVVLALAAGLSPSGCECAEREPYDATESTGVTSLATTAAESTSTVWDTTTQATTDTGDISRFLGIFHTESYFTPFGREVPNPGGPKLVNLEILADGTASMTMEICSLLFGTVEIAWRWEARPGPWLEFTPGPGEDSLRFMARTDVETVRATINEECELLFEVDGELITSEIFRPGKACWVNRCDPVWTVHIDYCDGEPPPCE